MTTLAAYNFSATDEAGNALADIEVEVSRETSGLPLTPCYADKEGTTPLGNPFAWADGAHVLFYVAGGFYKITVRKDGDLINDPWRDVAIGLAAGADSAPAPAQVEITSGSSYDVVDEEIIRVNKTIAGAITLNLPPAADRAGRALVVIDQKGDAATNNITLQPDNSQSPAETINGNATDLIAVNKGRKTYTPLASGGWLISA